MKKQFLRGVGCGLLLLMLVLVIGPAVDERAFNTSQFSSTGGLMALAVGVPLTNAVNHGTALASPTDSVATSEQFGTGASASGLASLAVGSGATASADTSVAVGRSANSAGAQDSTAIGNGASATATGTTVIGRAASGGGGGGAATAVGAFATAPGIFSTAIGSAAGASAADSTAIGEGSIVGAQFNDSTGLGFNSTPNLAHQVMLGTSAEQTFVPGPFLANLSIAYPVLSNAPGAAVVTDIANGKASSLLTTNGNFTQTFSGNVTNGGRWEFTVHYTGTTNALWTFPTSYSMFGSDTNTVSQQTLPPNSFTTINWEYFTGFGSPTNYMVRSITTKSAQSKVTYVGNILYLDCSASTDFYVTLTNSATALVAFTNTPPVGQPYECLFTVKQDATGARLLTWTNIIDFIGAAQTAYTTNVNKVDVWRLKANPITTGRFHIVAYGTNYSN